MTKQQEIFRRAWGIAREAASRYGGKPSEYMQGGAVAQAYEEEDKATDIINRVLNAIREGLDYTTPKDTIGGEVMVRHNAGRVQDLVMDAIDKHGRLEVARRLQKIWPDIDSMLDRLLYAVYDSEYAIWGAGGRTAYEAAMKELSKVLDIEDLEGEVYERENI